ncbi:MAG: anaerobic ribonucleoside-triphosphate reductase [Candidatus Bathyarchaeia archaeon]
MSASFEKSGVDILGAASSPLRMRILKLLKSKGPLPYTEIMAALGLDPIRDAGKFVYHLKSVTGTRLVTLDKNTKKYTITELGEIVVNFERDLEEYVAARRGRLYVRTSRLSLEEFEREKIANSLISEAGVPYELAHEIAAEAEERLLRLRTSYLTAPLIREFINAILIEKRLEDYRHKLTRLGMPVHDVSELLKHSSEKMLDVQAVKEAAGAAVMEEYVLLNSLPRNIADAHLSGDIHIDNIGEWILKPSEIIHDLRFFLENGLPTKKPPKTLQGALAMAEQVYYLARPEVTSEQCFDMFNVFLAPYAIKTPKDQLKEQLYHFFTNIRQDVYSYVPAGGLSLGFEVSIPSFLSDTKAVGPDGEYAGKYADYAEAADDILEASIDAAIEASVEKLLLNPRLIFKVRRFQQRTRKFEGLMMKIHQFAAKTFLPYLANLESEEKTVYTATGLRVDDSWTGNWEDDCMRTGNAGSIFLNLPRIAQEAHRKIDRFQSIVETKLNLAAEAFQRKSEALNERLRQSLLPFLHGGVGRSYFIERNATYAISLLGLDEAVRTFMGSSLSESEKAVEFAFKITESIGDFIESTSKKLGLRLLVAQRPQDEASSRLAKLDVARYGPGQAVTEGVRDYPYYTDLFTVPLSSRIGLHERILLEGRFQAVTPGGHLASICLAPTGQDPRKLLSLTEQALSDRLLFFTYTATCSHCRRCNKTFLGMKSTCPECSSTNLSLLGRPSALYAPLELWSEAKRRDVESRTLYSVG